jgi:hypothetical protein
MIRGIFWISAGLLLALVSAGLSEPVSAASGPAVQDRMDRDARQGLPLIAHVVVALADNTYQGIVPVPKELGNGQDPRRNLYWGALYGVKTFFRRQGGWQTVAHSGNRHEGVLRRAVFTTAIERRGIGRVPVYVVAEAWDGRKIQGAIKRFMEMARGRQADRVVVSHQGRSLALAAGGQAHVIAYVGHNGLMEFPLPETAPPAAGQIAKSAIVLACASSSYFDAPLAAAGVHRLLLTKGLMAPEAYTLDAVLKHWFAGEPADAAHHAASAAYCRFQKCRKQWALRRLFSFQP